MTATIQPKLTSAELAHRFLRATDPGVDLTSDDIAELIEQYARQQNRAAEAALQDALASMEESDRQMRLERAKKIVIAHGLDLVVGYNNDVLRQVPDSLELPVKNAIALVKEVFP